MSWLFSQSRRHLPKKTLYFIVPNRNHETLHRIITDNVLNGTTIYTDEWNGYNGLSEKGYNHKTICHKRRFSRFEFEGNVAMRVTTNHIEGMWVELRKALKYLNKRKFAKYTGSLDLGRLQKWKTSLKSLWNFCFGLLCALMFLDRE